MAQRETIGDHLRRIKQLFKKRDKRGFLYNKKEELRRVYKRVVLYSIFVSEDDTFLFRPHIFDVRTKPAKTVSEWHEWLADNHGNILRDSILPGMTMRTDKFWALRTLIGWAPTTKKREAKFKGGFKLKARVNADTSNRVSSVGKRRHKTKRKGR